MVFIVQYKSGKNLREREITAATAMGMMPRGFLYFEMSTAPHSASAITPSKTAIAISVAITLYFLLPLFFFGTTRNISCIYISGKNSAKNSISASLPSEQQ